MGQVYDIHDSPDQAQSHGGQPVDRADQQTINHGSEDARHVAPLAPHAITKWSVTLSELSKPNQRSCRPAARSLVSPACLTCLSAIEPEIWRARPAGRVR